MGLRDRVRRLERFVRGEQVAVRQFDGTTLYFPQSDIEPAFLNALARVKRGPDEDLPPEHPLITAARNSPDPEWAKSFYSAEPGEPVQDLSE